MNQKNITRKGKKKWIERKLKKVNKITPDKSFLNRFRLGKETDLEKALKKS